MSIHSDSRQGEAIPASKYQKYRTNLSRNPRIHWMPSGKASIIDIVQRFLDAWVEVLREAEVDLVQYGRKEEELHSGNLFSKSKDQEVLLTVEYGDNANDLRIHAAALVGSEWWAVSRDLPEIETRNPCGDLNEGDYEKNTKDGFKKKGTEFISKEEEEDKKIVEMPGSWPSVQER